ncbi:aldehyde dehydrogenase [Thozetella sp. PMI_491]|nr:aldehyde dehydrogenase [Thozetella sp. PMI_491]
MAIDTGAAQNGHTSTLSDPQELFIGGSYRPAAENATFAVVNPMTGKTIYDCASASVGDYEAAIENAHEAFSSWKKTPPSKRRLIFLKAADILETYLTQDAPEILSSEVSATQAWIKVNILATAGILRETAGLVTHIKGEIVPADRPGTTILIEREAVGVVFAISPWNAPVNLTARAIATPLICGNSVVLKPSEFSPKCQHLVVRALTAAGLPAGSLNFLPTAPANAATVTEFAVKHPKVRRVNFTGSDRVGKIIAGWAAECLKQCVLELGGKAPAIVLEDANIEDAVEAVVFGGLSNAGQICMSTERVLLHNSIAEEFKAKLIDRVKGLKVGNHEEEDVSISGLYTPASAPRVLGLVKDAIAQGATMLCGDLRTAGPNNTILAPHILEGVTTQMDVFHKESFGPILCLTQFSMDQQAIALANNSEFSLCASVFSRDVMRALDVAREVRAGSCHINGPTVYIEATLPNGGTGGASGYGRFGGMAGVEEFTERKILSLAKPGQKYMF